MKAPKRKIMTTKAKRPSPYAEATTLQKSLRQLHLAQRDSDQWLVTVCQHIIINKWTRAQIADHILATFDTGYHQPTVQEADTIAGRLYRLSRNEDALREIKYGMQPIAKRITMKMTAI